MKYIFWCLDVLNGFAGGIYQFLRLIFQGLLWLASPILRPLHALQNFAMSWLGSREFSFLAEGLPALLAGLGLSASVYAAWLPTQNSQIAQYMDRALQLHQKGETDAATLLMTKVERLSGDQAPVNFRRAVILEEMGYVDSAYSIIDRLAPVSKPGYLLAHEWMADKLVAHRENPKALELLKTHIDHILALSPGHVGVHRFQAIHYMEQNDFKRAIYHMARAVKDNPTLHLQYARLLYQNGLWADAKKQAGLALVYYDERQAKEELDEAESNELMVHKSMALGLLGDYGAAVSTLRPNNVDPEDTKMRNMLGSIYVAWSKSIKFDGTIKPWINKLELLNLALELAPESPAVLAQIGTLAEMEGPKAEEADAILRELLARGRAQATIHFIFGTRAAREVDFELSVFHLERAVELNPNVLEALNNLAWVLINKDTPNCERALQFINRALELKPDSASFRETRGQAHLKLENWKQAISDLEYALLHISKLETGERARPKIHASLALAYSELGDKGMAKIHGEKEASFREAFESKTTEEKAELLKESIESNKLKSDPENDIDERRSILQDGDDQSE